MCIRDSPVQGWFVGPGFLEQKIPDGERIHPGSIEAPNRVGGTAHNGFAFYVQRGVQDAWDASASPKRLDERPKQRIHLAAHCLGPSRVITSVQRCSNVLPP